MNIKKLKYPKKLLNILYSRILKKSPVTVFCLIFIFLVLFIRLQGVSADDFLKFYWKFNEGSGTVASDSSGNTPSYPGTLYNDPTWISGGGLAFDGIDDYVRTDQPLAGSMGVSNQAYTLSASVRVAEGETDGNIIHISDGANGVGWCIAMLHLHEGKFRAIGWNNGEVTAIAPTEANIGEWYSIANTWSPETQEMRLYVNGELVAATPMSNFTAAGTNVYVFAGFNPSGCNNNHGWFKGDIKDVRIYSRAITQSEAEANSEASISTPTPTPPPTSTPTPIPTNNPSNNNSNEVSAVSSTTSCGSQSPSTAPNLFQISTSPDSATLYFVPVSPVTGYIISYGISSQANQHSVSFDNQSSGGVLSYTINSLSQGTEYFFKLQGKNGCATGSWSSILPGKTTVNTKNSNLIHRLSQTPTPTMRGNMTIIDKEQSDLAKSTTTQNQSGENNGYYLEIVVKNDGQPVVGATVEIHSTPRKTVTDKNGIARFENVEGGEHTVYLSYEGYKGEEKISLTSDNKNVVVNLTVQLNPDTNWLGRIVLPSISLLLGIIIYLLFYIRKRKYRTLSINMG